MYLYPYFNANNAPRTHEMPDSPIRELASIQQTKPVPSIPITNTIIHTKSNPAKAELQKRLAPHPKKLQCARSTHKKGFFSGPKFERLLPATPPTPVPAPSSPLMTLKLRLPTLDGAAPVPATVSRLKAMPAPPASDRARNVPDRRTPSPLSILSAFQPSSSLSNLKRRSFSSLNSLSTLLAARLVSASLLWSSSMVLRRRSVLSRVRVRSSLICEFCLSLRESWVSRSRRERSWLRVLRASAAWVLCRFSS